MRTLSRSLSVTVLALSALSLACGGGGDGPVEPPPTVTISVSPTTSTVDAGSSSTFTATVRNASSGAVTWAASGGTIAGNGNSASWTAPFDGGPYTITATSVAEPGRTATATVTVRALAVSVSADTATVASGETRAFTASVANSANTDVVWTASGGAIVGSATANAIEWTAPVGSGSYELTARSAADSSKSATVMVTVAPVMLTVVADSLTVGAGGTRTLSATVSGAADSAVVWTASGGAIIGDGTEVLWEAPALGGVYSLTATSVLDSTVSAAVSIAVDTVGLAFATATAELFRGEPVTLNALVSGAAVGRDSVSWTSTCGPVVVTARASATVTGPSVPGDCDVSARSTLDTTQTATVTVTVRPEWLVTSTDDVSDGDCTFAHCSLREAILVSNNAPDADVVLLGRTPLAGAPASPMRPTLTLPATITLSSALPAITTSLSLLGPGAEQLTIDAAADMTSARRVFEIDGEVAVTISGMTLTGGRDTIAGGVMVQNGADVVFDRLTVRDNRSTNGPGGGAVVFGGAALLVESSLFEGNIADGTLGSGGALAAGGMSTLHVRGGVVRGNEARTSFGGGITSSDAEVTLDTVTIENNQTTGGGGGVSIWDKGTLVINGGVLRNNVSTFVGGGLIAGASDLSSTNRVSLVMQGVRVEGNRADVQGGGMQLTRNVTAIALDLAVVDNEISGPPRSDTPAMGGGVFGGQQVNLTLIRSTVARNRIVSPTTLSLEDGGAGVMFISAISGTTLIVDGSTIADNVSAVRGGGAFAAGRVVASFTNSTVSGNSAPTGGGVLAASTTVLRNVTMAGNRATVTGAGLGVAPTIVATVDNSLFADNRLNVAGQSCATEGSGTITSRGYNLSDDVSCTSFTNTADQTNTSAGLDLTLADNGGPTLTHALLAGSAAIDAANPAICAPADQRGVAREGTCDIGAVEFADGTTVTIAGRRIGPTSATVFRRGAPRRVPARFPLRAVGAGHRTTGQRIP